VPRTTNGCGHFLWGQRHRSRGRGGLQRAAVVSGRASAPQVVRRALRKQSPKRLRNRLPRARN
jgi:hypothetical protein